MKVVLRFFWVALITAQISNGMHAGLLSAIEHFGCDVLHGLSSVKNATTASVSQAIEAQNAAARNQEIDDEIGFNYDRQTVAENQAHDLYIALQEKNVEHAFILGASTSEHQCSKQCTPECCSWSRFEVERDLPRPTDSEYPMDLWNHYQEYIKQASEKLGLTSLRFSIEWALVQPEGPGDWNKDVLDHYADQFICAIKHGITPVICFHHYTDPCWFIDKGGFERRENIAHFSLYCASVYAYIMQRIMMDEKALEAYKALGERLPLWATFNSPEGYAFKGYREMAGPPANPRKKGLRWVMRVLRNMMLAHVEVYAEMQEAYQSITDEYGNLIAKPKIGFLKNIHQLEPSQKSWAHWAFKPLSALICGFGNALQGDPIYNFFTTGRFTSMISGVREIKDMRAPKSLDFIGLNYYSNREMMLGRTVKESDSRLATDNGHYRISPAGFYRAIAEIYHRLAKPLSIPIYVTENGIATFDNQKRTKFYSAYMSALIKAIDDGYPVYGYLTWTLADNYEWPKVDGARSIRKYGLTAIDPETHEMVIKSGAIYYGQFAQSFKRLQCADLSM